MITLGQVAARTRMLELACKRCPKSGRLSVARLIEDHGPECEVIQVFTSLEDGCPNQTAHSSWDRCFVYAPGLSRWF